MGKNYIPTNARRSSARSRGRHTRDPWVPPTENKPMHILDIPAGSRIRLTATARPKARVHRWDIRVLAKSDVAPRLTYGSEIGGDDREQSVHIPAQDADCRLEVWARHTTASGWGDDRSALTVDTPSRLQISFSDGGPTGVQEDDVLLSFEFSRGSLSPGSPVLTD